MVEKRRSASLRALDEIHNTLIRKCKQAHKRINQYGGDSNCTEEKAAFDRAKDKVIDKISKEAEAYLIEKYKKYGLVSVPVCHRSSSSGEDRLKIDIKITEFPECKVEVAAKKQADDLYEKDLKAIEQWHLDALTSIALKEELPAVPELSRT